VRGPFFQASYCFHINESLPTKKGEGFVSRLADAQFIYGGE